MARLLTAGWEYNNALDGGAWDLNTANVSSSTTAKRYGARGLLVQVILPGPAYLTHSWAANGNTGDVFIRVWINPQAHGDGGLIYLEDGGVGDYAFSVRLNSDWTLELWRGGGSPIQLGVDSAAMTVSTWNRVNLQYIFSSGTATATLNGVDFANGTADAAVNNPNIIHLGLGIPANADAGNIYLDDFALNDSTGSDENGRPPDRTGVTLYLPDADGDNAMGSRGGTDTGADWSQLSQNPPDDITTYYILDADNDIIDVNTAINPADPNGIIAGSKIHLVQTGVRHRCGAAGTMSYQARIKSQSGGTVQSGTLTTHNDTTWRTNGDVAPRNYKLTAYVDPQTGLPWTKAGLDTGMQVGAIVIDADPDAWITSVWGMVEFEQAITMPKFTDEVFDPPTPLGINREGMIGN